MEWTQCFARGYGPLRAIGFWTRRPHRWPRRRREGVPHLAPPPSLGPSTTASGNVAFERIPRGDPAQASTRSSGEFRDFLDRPARPPRTAPSSTSFMNERAQSPARPRAAAQPHPPLKAARITSPPGESRGGWLCVSSPGFHRQFVLDRPPRGGSSRTAKSSLARRSRSRAAPPPPAARGPHPAHGGWRRLSQVAAFSVRSRLAAQTWWSSRNNHPPCRRYPPLRR